MNISAIGYRLIQTRLGRKLFRESAIGRAAIRHLYGFARSLPLPTPQVIYIDPSSVCNFRCRFCPTGHPDLLRQHNRRQAIMEWGLFTRIIDGMKEFPGQVTTLCLHKDGEPLLNPRLPAMIRYAKEAGIAGYVETTTNASLLTTDKAKEIVDSGLDAIRISVEHVSDEGYRRLTGTSISYEAIRRNVERLFGEKAQRNSKLRVLVKIIDTGLTEDEKARFHQHFGLISDTCKIDGLMGWSNSNETDFLLGLSPRVGIDGQTPLKPNRVVCPEPFREMCFNADGSVVPCCADWTHQLKIGEARTTSPLALWNNTALALIRQTHLSGERHQLGPCAHCQYMLGIPDIFDLDDNAPTLLSQLNPPSNP